MKKLSILAVALLWATTMYCQDPTSVSSSVARLNQINNGSGLIPHFDLRYDGVKGSKFFYENYTAGEIWLSKDRHYGKEYTYKFDEEQNTVQIKMKDGKESVRQSLSKTLSAVFKPMWTALSRFKQRRAKHWLPHSLATFPRGRCWHI